MEVSKFFKDINIITNFFSFNIHKDYEIYKYHVKIEPELPLNQNKAFGVVISKLKKQLSEKLGHNLCQNFTIYTPTPPKEGEIIFDNVLIDNTTYQVQLLYLGTLKQENLQEMINFFGRIFKLAQKQLKFVEINKKYFNPNKSVGYENYKLEIWPGYSSAVKLYFKQILVNVDMSYKLIRHTTVLDEYFELKKNPRSTQASILNELQGCTVMTKYNKKMYRIDGFTFDQSIMSEFELKNKEKISYYDYYKKFHAIEIQDKKQPLILHIPKRGNQKIYLIPELCYLTGITDKMRSDYMLMKDIQKTTKGLASQRIKDTSQLINEINNQPKGQDVIKQWNIVIENIPINIQGYKLNSGNIVMGAINGGANFSIPFENSQDFDRKTQHQMYSQPPLTLWGIFASSQDRNITEQFIDTLKESTLTFNYPVEKPPRVIYVESNKWEDWKKQMQIINEKIQFCVFILPGQKKNGFNYKEIKEFMIKEKGVPCQCIVAKTLQGKGLRSICNKILVQICAKIGGVPWTVSDMPFTSRPTMIVGLDEYTRGVGQNKKTIISICTTLNKTFSSYWSKFSNITNNKSHCDLLRELFVEGIQNFKQVNKNITPELIIVFRDGISEGMRAFVEVNEVNGIKQALTQLEIENTKIIFICINMKNDSKFYVGDIVQGNDIFKNVKGPPQGTLINGVVTEGPNDFYLISQQSNNGIATPTHYFILLNELLTDDEQQNNKIMEQIQLFCYKQCFLYYNWVGSVKAPAPVQYAKRLSNLAGDKLNFPQYYPNENLGQKKSLYYI